MLRSTTTALCVLVLGSTSFAQSDLRSRLHPITSPVKNAGTLNLVTGAWTRATNGQASAAGPEIVYANTCNSHYYLGQATNEVFTDEGAIPDPGQPTTPSTSIPGAFDTGK